MQSTCADSFDSLDRADSRFVAVRTFRPGDDPASDLPQNEIDSKLVGESELMRDLKQSMRLVARSDETVLITGESGTGKELIARAVHDLSPRWNKPFLPVNCGALTESLLESELFGHVKGAFTGAMTNKKGFFEAASGGTIFLDEFAEMSLTTQQRLLRVLQEGTVRPVGSTEPKETELDTRVVVATNHDLKCDISEGKFRHDLYYRVNVLEIRAPALRDRREDILPLAQHFLRRYNERNWSHVSERISPGVLAILEPYSWPGNVRELENITKRLALRASDTGTITEADVRSVPELSQLTSSIRRQVIEVSQPPQELTQPYQVSRKQNHLSTKRKEPCRCRCSEELEAYCTQIDQAGGNLAEAARQLNMPRTTLRKRLILLQTKCAT